MNPGYGRNRDERGRDEQQRSDQGGGARGTERNAPDSRPAERPRASDAFRAAVDRDQESRSDSRKPAGRDAVWAAKARERDSGTGASREGAGERSQRPTRAWGVDRSAIERARQEDESNTVQSLVAEMPETRPLRPHEIEEHVPLKDKRKARQTAMKPWEAAGWEREVEVESLDSAPRTVDREVDSGGPDARVAKRRNAPEAVARELTAAVGSRRGARLEQGLMEASKAFERERFGDALRILKPLAEEAPDVAAVRELTGLCLYRQGKWAEAIRHLQRFAEVTGSVEQNPVLADCHRALRHYTLVDDLWEELSSSSPSADLVAEGRIVAAGALADQGKLNDAISLMERASLSAKRPKPHHLRLWYALGDLNERAGDMPRARELFERVASHGDFADVASRLTSL